MTEKGRLSAGNPLIYRVGVIEEMVKADVVPTKYIDLKREGAIMAACISGRRHG